MYKITMGHRRETYFWVDYIDLYTSRIVTPDSIGITMIAGEFEIVTRLSGNLNCHPPSVDWVEQSETHRQSLLWWVTFHPPYKVDVMSPDLTRYSNS